MGIENHDVVENKEENVISTIAVRWNSLAYRSEPGFKKGTKEGAFKKGTRLEVVEKKGNWLKVKSPTDDKERVWVWSGLIKNEAELKLGRSVRFVKEKSLEARRDIDPMKEEDLNSFAPEDEAKLASYADKYSKENAKEKLFNDHNLLNRTFEHRLIDHEIFLTDLFGEKSRDNKMPSLKAMLFPGKDFKPLFVDIGPGLANRDDVLGGGKGKPAVTLQEIAEKFPKMEAIALELPSEVDVFLGKNPEYKIEDDKKQELLAHENIKVVSGNGLDPLKQTLSTTENNPYHPDRKIPEVDAKTALIIRSANALDIFEKWEKVKPSFEQIAKDYKAIPVLYFFNREILIKPAGSLQWSIVGKTSNRGFNHKTRDLVNEGYAYKLDSKKIGKVYDRYVQKQLKPGTVGLNLDSEPPKQPL